MIVAKNWQRIEGALVFVGGLLIYSLQSNSISWWVCVLLFFAPDISFAGYALGPRIGSVVYNCVHIYAFGTVLIALGILQTEPWLLGLGALWLAHSGFDRLFGYGLKSPDSFSITHLGRIGKVAKQNSTPPEVNPG